MAIITKFTLVWKPWKIYVHFYQFSDLWDVTSSWTHLPYLIIVNVTQLAEIGPIYQHQADSGQLWPVNYVMIMYDYDSIIAFRCWNRNIPEQDQLPMYWLLAQYISRHDIEYTEETGHCYAVIVQLRRNDHHGLVMTSLCPQEIVHVPKCWLSPGSWVHAERSATGHYSLAICCYHIYFHRPVWCLNSWVWTKSADTLKIGCCHDANPLSSLATPGVVIMSTLGAADDTKVAIMTTLRFQFTDDNNTAIVPSTAIHFARRHSM